MRQSSTREVLQFFSLQGMMSYVAAPFSWDYLSSNWVALPTINFL